MHLGERFRHAAQAAAGPIRRSPKCGSCARPCRHASAASAGSLRQSRPARSAAAVSVQSTVVPRLTKPCASGGDTCISTTSSGMAPFRTGLQFRSERWACSRRGPATPPRVRCRPGKGRGGGNVPRIPDACSPRCPASSCGRFRRRAVRGAGHQRSTSTDGVPHPDWIHTRAPEVTVSSACAALMRLRWYSSLQIIRCRLCTSSCVRASALLFHHGWCLRVRLSALLTRPALFCALAGGVCSDASHPCPCTIKAKTHVGTAILIENACVDGRFVRNPSNYARKLRCRRIFHCRAHGSCENTGRDA